LAESLIDRLSSFFPSAILLYTESWTGPHTLSCDFPHTPFGPFTCSKFEVKLE
jgi:hypothetical protein